MLGEAIAKTQTFDQETKTATHWQSTAVHWAWASYSRALRMERYCNSGPGAQGLHLTEKTLPPKNLPPTMAAAFHSLIT